MSYFSVVGQWCGMSAGGVEWNGMRRGNPKQLALSQRRCGSVGSMVFVVEHRFSASPVVLGPPAWPIISTIKSRPYLPVVVST
jgi:hypothetical protein